MRKNTRTCQVLAALAVGALLALPAVAASGPGNPGNPGILPPNANAYGASYGDWALDWLQWALGIPVDQNPLVDTTGEFCGVGQDGKVWFLAGSTGEVMPADVELPVIIRECTVPVGTPLFFPMLNGMYYKTEPEEPTDPDEIYEWMLSWLTAQYWCAIDGRPVQHPEQYLTLAPVGAVTLPDNSLWGSPAGTYEPAATVGWYLMLAPLRRGEHTIELWVRDTWMDGDVEMQWGFHVIYQLTVENPRRARGPATAGQP